MVRKLQFHLLRQRVLHPARGLHYWAQVRRDSTPRTIDLRHVPFANRLVSRGAPLAHAAHQAGVQKSPHGALCLALAEFQAIHECPSGYRFSSRDDVPGSLLIGGQTIHHGRTRHVGGQCGGAPVNRQREVGSVPSVLRQWQTRILSTPAQGPARSSASEESSRNSTDGSGIICRDYRDKSIVWPKSRQNTDICVGKPRTFIDFIRNSDRLAGFMSGFLV